MIKKINRDILYEKTKKIYIIFYMVYFIALFIQTTTLIVDYPVMVPFLKAIKGLMYICFLGRVIFISPKIIKDISNIKLNIKKVIIIFLSLLLIMSILGNLIVTGNRRLTFLMIVILASYDVYSDYIIKYTAKLQITLTCIIVALSVFGVTQNYIVGRGNIARHSLGFVYTTNLSQMVVFSTILTIYIKQFKTSVTELIYIQLLNLLVYFLTNSRTEFILLESVIVMCTINVLKTTNKLDGIKRMLACFFAYTFPIYPIISFILVCLYPIGGVYDKLNSLLSNRLAQTYGVLSEYGISTFGKNIDFIGNGITDKLKHGYTIASNYVDNEYIQLLFSNGYIFILAFILLLYFCLIYLYKKQDYKKLLICYIYLLFGILNPRIVNILYCPVMFIVFYEITNFLRNMRSAQSKYEGELK